MHNFNLLALELTHGVVSIQEEHTFCRLHIELSIFNFSVLITDWIVLVFYSNSSDMTNKYFPLQISLYT